MTFEQVISGIINAIPELEEADKSAKIKALMSKSQEKHQTSTFGPPTLIHDEATLVFEALEIEPRSPENDAVRAELVMQFAPFQYARATGFPVLGVRVADQNLTHLFRVNNKALIDMMFEADRVAGNNSFAKALTQCSGYSSPELLAGVDRLLQESSFNAKNWVDSHSSSCDKFQVLPAIKAAIATSEHLEQLFLCQDEVALEGKNWAVPATICPNTLINELLTKYKNNIVALAQDNLSKLGHKRMKRLYELLKPLATLAVRERLEDPYLSVAIQKCQIYTYTNVQWFQRAGRGNSLLKRDWLKMICNDLENRIVKDEGVISISFDKTNGDANSVLKKAYFAVYKKESTGKKDIDTMINMILDGYNTAMVITWLPEDYLRFIGAGTKLCPNVEGNEVAVTPSADAIVESTKEGDSADVDLAVSSTVEESRAVNLAILNNNRRNRGSVRVSLANVVQAKENAKQSAAAVDNESIELTSDNQATKASGGLLGSFNFLSSGGKSSSSAASAAPVDEQSDQLSSPPATTGSKKTSVFAGFSWPSAAKTNTANVSLTTPGLGKEKK